MVILEEEAAMFPKFGQYFFSSHLTVWVYKLENGGIRIGRALINFLSMNGIFGVNIEPMPSIQLL
jgi:hypothetical protein